MGFNKFQWIDAVAADGRIPDGERFVLTMTAIRYVTYGEDVFHVRQTTIAERFATSRSTVQRAQACARELGYIVRVQPRQRGRGHHGPDHHRLVIPVKLTPNTDEIGVTDDGNRRQESQKKASKSTQIGVTADSPTSGNDTPKGSLKGSLIGSLIGGWLDEPRCDDHRNNPHPPPCHRCKKAREKTEAQQPRPSTTDALVAQTQALKEKFRNNAPLELT